MAATRGWRLARAAAATVVTAVLLGVPTDVLDTPLFTRMTPVRGWEYPMLAATALLAGLWAGLPGQPGGAGKVGVSGLVTTLAIGCPVCNKVVVALLGVSGALGVWAPIQPLLGIASVLSLAVAVGLRWRGTRATACPTPHTAEPHGTAPDAVKPDDIHQIRGTVDLARPVDHHAAPLRTG
ncbi:hypothetical protein [Pseudonocardia sp. GCM10023141]|uniref:hypothetical protein n=1 Tax=Pseudonocardia sp. GCM10023141 TaxID=3252653 RepID=UPI00361126D5